MKARLGKTISPDLTEWKKPDEKNPAPGAPRPPAIEALAISSLDPREIWVSTTNRLVQLSHDGGAHWQKVTPPGIEAPSEILYVEPSHFDAAEAFLTVGTSRQAVPPQILRTRDYGATWQSIVNGLPADESVLVVREDPVRKGLLYAGTASTVFVSFDDGDHWHPLTLNLPAASITDIDVHGDDLAISTYGRGLWILDDIAPIRDLTPEMLAAPVSLLPPVTAMRVRWDNWEDTPLPIETPSAKNPVDGVLIDYYLKTAHPGEAEDHHSRCQWQRGAHVHGKHAASPTCRRRTCPNTGLKRRNRLMVPQGCTALYGTCATTPRKPCRLPITDRSCSTPSTRWPTMPFRMKLRDNNRKARWSCQETIPSNSPSMDKPIVSRSPSSSIPAFMRPKEDLEVQLAQARRIVSGMNVSDQGIQETRSS